MATSAANPFDRLPDELVEYIFLLLTYSPPIERFNHVNNPSSSFYFAYMIHVPELRRTFKDLLSMEKGVDFRRLYFSNPFHPDYNLLNFTGTNESDAAAWSAGVELEPIPVGSDRLYDAFGRISSCYATSYFWGHYNRNNLQLLRKGEEKLTSLNPVIEFSVCVAGRWDCSSTCTLELYFSDNHRWNYQRTFSNGDHEWYRITYRYADYPQNQMPSHVSVHLQGKDRQYWSGNYGVKFAQIKLRLILREENETGNHELEEKLVDPEQPADEELL